MDWIQRACDAKNSDELRQLQAEMRQAPPAQDVADASEVIATRLDLIEMCGEPKPSEDDEE